MIMRQRIFRRSRSSAAFDAPFAVCGSSRKAETSARKAAMSLLENPDRLLSVTQVGVTLASLALGWAARRTIFNILMAR